MRFTVVILTAFFCLNAKAATSEPADSTSDEALIMAAEKLIQEGGRIESKEANASAAEQKESEIPVQLSAPPKAKESSDVVWRLVASFAVLAFAGGILYYATRRWTKPKEKAAKGARIEMVHQYHMGPRKSIALIRVAGETILLGVTDHNVSMIKPVTLIDDELEGLMKKDFNNFLEDDFSIEDVRTALRA